MRWKDKDISFWLMKSQGGSSSGLDYSERCEICDVAWALEMSEKGFFDKFDSYERAQLIATYRSKMEREFVVSMFPQKPPKGKE